MEPRYEISKITKVTNEDTECVNSSNISIRIEITLNSIALRLLGLRMRNNIKATRDIPTVWATSHHPHQIWTLFIPNIKAANRPILVLNMCLARRKTKIKLRTSNKPIDNIAESREQIPVS